MQNTLEISEPSVFGTTVCNKGYFHEDTLSNKVLYVAASEICEEDRGPLCIFEHNLREYNNGKKDGSKEEPSKLNEEQLKEFRQKLKEFRDIYRKISERLPSFQKEGSEHDEAKVKDYINIVQEAKGVYSELERVYGHALLMQQPNSKEVCLYMDGISVEATADNVNFVDARIESKELMDLASDGFEKYNRIIQNPWFLIFESHSARLRVCKALVRCSLEKMTEIFDWQKNTNIKEIHEKMEPLQEIYTKYISYLSTGMDVYQEQYNRYIGWLNNIADIIDLGGLSISNQPIPLGEWMVRDLKSFKKFIELRDRLDTFNDYALKSNIKYINRIQTEYNSILKDIHTNEWWNNNEGCLKEFFKSQIRYMEYATSDTSINLYGLMLELLEFFGVSSCSINKIAFTNEVIFCESKDVSSGKSKNSFIEGPLSWTGQWCLCKAIHSIKKGEIDANNDVKEYLREFIRCKDEAFCLAKRMIENSKESIDEKNAKMEKLEKLRIKFNSLCEDFEATVEKNKA